MATRLLAATNEAIHEAAALIRAGGLVAFPTETVYGLGANALDATAVAGIFRAKGRPTADPLIVHLARGADLPNVVATMPPVVELLAATCWPGPLTLVLPRGPAIPDLVTAGRDTVAVRVPAHPVAHALIVAAGVPIAAPSANRFGHTSPTCAVHVLVDLAGRIDLVLDGGDAPIGLESTVLDLTGPVPTLLRPGGVSLERLRELLGTVVVGARVAAEGVGQRSPGLRERHYAPVTPFRLCIGPVEAARAWLHQQVVAVQAAGGRAGLLVPAEDAAHFAALGADIECLGPAADLEQIAHHLYAALRSLDTRTPTLILARDLGTAGLGLALRDRMSRAASGDVVVLA